MQTFGVKNYKMIVIDIIVGHFLPSIFGWIFLIVVMGVESLLLSHYLSKNFIVKKIHTAILVSNLITAVIGSILLDPKNIGGQLLNWIPIDQYHGNIRLDRTYLCFISSYLGSAVVESIVHILILKNSFPIKRIILGTVYVNSLTYILAAIAMGFFLLYLK